jgi:hypothetical protein
LDHLNLAIKEYKEVKSKMVTLKEIQRQIAKEKKKIQKEDNLAKKLKEKRKAQAELIMLKNRKAIAAGKKAKAISGRFGRALLRTGSKVGKRVGPAIVKQAKLIREQQLRDDARERALLNKTMKSKNKSKRKPKKTTRNRSKRKSSKR